MSGLTAWALKCRRGPDQERSLVFLESEVRDVLVLLGETVDDREVDVREVGSDLVDPLGKSETNR